MHFAIVAGSVVSIPPSPTYLPLVAVLEGVLALPRKSSFGEGCLNFQQNSSSSRSLSLVVVVTC